MWWFRQTLHDAFSHSVTANCSEWVKTKLRWMFKYPGQHLVSPYRFFYLSYNMHVSFENNFPNRGQTALLTIILTSRHDFRERTSEDARGTLLLRLRALLLWWDLRLVWRVSRVSGGSMLDSGCECIASEVAVTKVMHVALSVCYQ